MKKALSLSIFLVLSLISCKKNSETICTNTNTNSQASALYTNSTLGFDFDEIGEIHNEGLDYIEARIGSTTFSLDESYGATINGYAFTFLKTYISSLTTSDSVQYDSMCRVSFREDLYGDPSAMWEESIESMNNAIPSAELSLIDACAGVIAYARQNYVDVDDQYTYVNAQLNSLIANFEEVNWTNGEGSLAGGLLYIARSSSNYWYDRAGNESEPVYLNLLQADAAGYLYGWTKSWLWDGETDPDKRIKAGMGQAMDCSTLGLL